MRPTASRIFPAALAAFSVATAGCLETAADSTATSPPIQHVLFVDLSDSPSKQAERWCTAASTLLFDRLKAGDSVVAFAVGDRTAEMEPLYDRATRAVSEDEGMDGDVTSYAELQQVKADGAAAVCRALRSPTRAHQTRLLAALQRISSDPARQTRVLFFSDGLEASDLLNLERTKLSDDNLAPLVKSAAAHERWKPAMLRGVDVRFVLDSPRLDDPGRRPLNDRRSLEQFWRLVVESLGGRLTRFDSRIAG